MIHPASATPMEGPLVPRNGQAEPTCPAPGPLRRFLPLGLVVVLALAVFASGAHKYLTLESLVIHRDRLGMLVTSHPVLALASFGGIYVVVTALGLPGGLILTAIGGLLFGTLIGGLAAIVSATIGATAIFLIARTAAGAHLAERAGALAARLSANFRENAFNYLLFLRLVPAFPFFLVNLVPALCNVSLRKYVLATAIGIIPGTFAFASVGSGLDSVIMAQGASYRACVAGGGANCHVDFNLASTLTPQLIIALVALALLSLVPVVARRVMKGAAQEAPMRGDDQNG